MKKSKSHFIDKREVRRFLCFRFFMSASVSLRVQLSPQQLEQLLAWYKIRDMLFGENHVKQDRKLLLYIPLSLRFLRSLLDALLALLLIHS
jgi:hypothetical protein